MGNLAHDILFRMPARDVIRYTLFKVTSNDELDARTRFCNDSETALTNPIEYIVGSTQHCRNCNFFRNVLFCSFESIKHIYIICENVLNVLLIFLQ